MSEEKKVGRFVSLWERKLLSVGERGGGIRQFVDGLPGGKRV